jgi:hypothetical protein
MVWNGITYTQSGVYTYGPVSNAAGCDSLVILTLTVNHSSSSQENVVTCGSFTWNGNTYTQSGLYTATGFINASGCDSTARLQLQILNGNTTVDTITGPVSVCAYMGSTPADVVYSVVAANASTFNWILPNHVTLVSSQSADVITVRFESSFTGGVIKVVASNACGQNPVEYSIFVSASMPSAAGSISGLTAVCAGNGNTGTEVMYSVMSIPGAVSYAWSLPAGATLVAMYDTAVLVRFDSSFTSGVISVAGSNGCGLGQQADLSVTRIVLGQPGQVYGPTDVCPYISSNSQATYSIDPIGSATGYIWQVPSGVTIVSGQGTTSLTVTFDNNFSADVIRVRAFNDCDSGVFTQLSLIRIVPQEPNAIQQTLISNACPVRQYSYSIAALPADADTIYWTIPSGAVIDSVTNAGLTIWVSYPTAGNSYTGAVTAQGVNDCGTGQYASLNVNIAACTPVGNGMSVKLYPNPSNGVFNLQVNSDATESVNVRLLDALGHTMGTFRMTPNQTIQVGGGLPAGTYFIQAIQGAESNISRAVKVQ